MGEWKEFDEKPTRNGMYIYQFPDGGISTMAWSNEGGWNTSCHNGKIYDEHAIEKPYMVRWFDHGEPPEVTEELKERLHKYLYEE